MAYEAVARKFLLRAKIGRRRELLLPMASRLAAAVRAAGLHEGCQSLAAVPSHRWTDLRRGFSPSLELARHLSRILCIPLSPGLLCRRIGPGRPAKRLTATGRWETTARQFRLRRPPGVTRLLLVDDVMTTGASAETCAGLLKESGAKVVRLAVWARRATK